MTIAAIAAAVLVGLLVNEMSDVSPWIARRIVGWSARLRYADSDRAEIRSEELAALINQRPGKLLKLGTASGFAAASITRRIRQRLTGQADPEPSISLDELRRVVSVDEVSNLVARYLYPNERCRGEWRRHISLPIKEMGYGIGAGAGIWYLGDLRVQLQNFGLPEYELVFAPSVVEIGLAIGVWSLWRVARWWLSRFTLTNKRLIVVKGVLVRRVAMAPLTNAADLTYRQLLLGRLFNYGTFTLRSVGILHPMRRIPYLPNVNELYRRAIEEMYEPAAVERRIRTGSEERIHERIALMVAAAMATDVWPLVRDTITEVMKNHRLGVAGQLDKEAERIATAKGSTQDTVCEEVAEAWRRRLEHLSNTYLASELEEAGEMLLGCLPETVQSWINARWTANSDAALPAGDGEPDRVPAHPPIPQQVATPSSLSAGEGDAAVNARSGQVE